MKPRAFSIFLTLCLCLTLLPVTAGAADPEPQEGAPVCDCETLCTADSVNADCPVCGLDLTQCAGTDAPEAEGGEAGGEPDQPDGVADMDPDVAAVQAMIDALPTADELAAMSPEDRQTVYEQVQAAYDAYNALTDEQKEQITGAEMFDALFAVFNGVVNALVSVGNFNIDGGTQNTDYSYSDGVLTINSSTPLTISTSSQTSDRIVISSGVNANITLAGVNIQAPANTSAIDVPNGASLTLTLANGSQNTLTVTVTSSSSNYNSAGIHVPDNASLTIQCAAAATDGSHQCTENGSCGKLSVTGGATTNDGCGGAGIGGNGTNQSQGETSGSVSIIGGDITIIGGSCPFPGPGIGGGTGMGNGGGCGAVYITGGIVAVTGGSCTGTDNGRGAAGIGGGNSSSPFNSAGSGGTVVITGGTVSVTGGTGIGNSGYGGTGIGGGASPGTGGAGGTVIILTDDVTVTGGKGDSSGGGTTGNDIGGGLGSSGTKGNDGSGIRPTEDGNYTVYGGNVTLPESVTFPDGITINIPDGTSLTLPEGASWPDNVTIAGGGSISPKLTATITIRANLDKTHDGNAVSLDNSGYTYTGDTTIPTITITWHEDNNGTIGNVLTSAPSATGIYWVKVSAADTSRYAAAEATKKFTISQPLAAPTGLTWSTTTPGQATWSAVASASGYTVQLYKDGSAQGDPVTASGTSQDFQITQAGSYTFTVTATGSGAYSDSSESSQSTALYTVSFDTNGGTGTIPMQLVPNSGTATEPTTAPTKTGHRFDGWYSDSGLNTAWNFGSDTVTAATTLYAKWTPLTYKVTLNTGGGTINSGNVTGYTYGVGATLPANVTRPGYTFAGWYERSDFSGEAVTAISAADTGEKTYYAKWEASTYKVTLNTNSGTINSSNVTEYTYGVGATLPTAENMTYTGHRFGGWYDNAELTGEAVTAISAADTGDKTYYAKWTKLYTVTVTAESGGTVSGGGTFEEGSAVTVTATTSSGYHFVRWTESGTQVSTSASYSFPLAADRSLTAEFARNSSGSGASYSPALDVSDGGTVRVSPRTPEAGDKVTITPNPDRGYEVDTVTVTDRNGRAVKVTANRDGTYRFTQPVGKVTIEVTFAPIAETPDLPFTDVAEDFWAADAISWAYENGYINGTSASSFSPSASISRQQVWMILARLSGADPASMAAARTWAVENGISDGTTPGTAVTRQQLAALLYRFAQLMGYDTTQGGMAIWEYADCDQISGYAEAAMDWAVSAGILNGTSATTLNPQGTASRAQFAVMLYRFMN